MILTLDIGNTHIVIGGFRGEDLIFLSRMATDTRKTEDEYAAVLDGILQIEGIPETEITGAIISSVVPPLNHTMQTALGKMFAFEPLIVGPGVRSGVNLLVDSPEQVGADLVCSAAAVRAYYQTPALVVDMGTATKMSVIDETGAFCGVSIIPGVKTGMRALSDSAAQLPQISLDAPKSVIGKNTVDAMQSGVVFGNAGMIDAMAERIITEYGRPLFVVATGGVAKQIVPHCKTKMQIDEQLILKGLNVIYQKNAKK